MASEFEEVEDVIHFLDAKTFWQVAAFMIAAVVILLVALVLNDTLVAVMSALFGDSVWWRVLVSVIIIVIALVLVYISRVVYNMHQHK